MMNFINTPYRYELIVIINPQKQPSNAENNTPINKTPKQVQTKQMFHVAK